MIGGGGSDLFVIPLSSNPFAQKVIIEVFESATESKIVLDVSDYSQSFGVSFKLAKNSKQVSRLARTKTSFIFNSDTHELLLNGNGSKRGLGLPGWSILFLENDSALDSTDLLVFRDNNLRQLDGTAFLGWPIVLSQTICRFANCPVNPVISIMASRVMLNPAEESFNAKNQRSVAPPVKLKTDAEFAGNWEGASKFVIDV